MNKFSQQCAKVFISLKEIEAFHNPPSTQIQNGDDELFDMARTKNLREADLSSLSEEKINLMKNSIYARHRLKFSADNDRSRDLSRYFSQKSWYAPDSDNSALVFDRFSDTEKYNSRFLTKYQVKRGYLHPK